MNRGFFALSSALLFFASIAQASSTWIMAVGTGMPGAPDLPVFTDDMSHFVNLCNKSGMKMKSQCKLFVDPKLNSASSGSPTRGGVLKEFADALNNAKPGDEVVLSLVDHGTPGFISSSCVHLNSIDAVCLNSIKDILKSKKPGVKVFIDADACFSGAFAELANRDVCTFTQADRFRAWDTLPGESEGFWSAADRAKTSGKSLTLSQIRNTGLTAISEFDGGGFGSQSIHDRVCKNEGKTRPRKVWRPN